MIEAEEEYNDQTLPGVVPGLCRTKSRELWLIWATIVNRQWTASFDWGLVQSLAILLNVPSKPSNLRTPHCLCYVRDINPENGEINCRFGLLFEVPSHIWRGNGLIKPMMLQKVFYLQAGVLVLTRLQLALKRSTSMLYLVGNLLHKVLRSQSILFS